VKGQASLDRVRSVLRAMNSLDVLLHAEEVLGLCFTGPCRVYSVPSPLSLQIDRAASEHTEGVSWTQNCASRAATRLRERDWLQRDVNALRGADRDGQIVVEVRNVSQSGN
jgi:hypothetical protein